MIKAILFDMDGVLIDARDWHYDSLNRALDLFGLKIDRDAHLASFDGLPTRKKLQMLTQSRGLSPKLHELINALKQRYTVELAYSRCRPIFHLNYALSRLKADGYKMAVCSNSVRRSVNLLMELSNLEQYLDVQLSNEDVSRAKPDPEIYQAAMARLQLEPSDCLIVEDNEHGVAAARASGAHVMVVSSIEDVTYDRVRAALDNAEGARP